MSETAFQPLGDTVLLPAASTAPSGVQALGSAPNVGDKIAVYRLVNSGSETVYIATGKTAGAAQTAAVIPTAGNAQDVLPLSAGSTEVLRLGADAFISGITASSGVNVFITPGTGI